MDVSFGELLKDWRSRRRISQLDLALAANVSARHIAFLETGRSKPSRAMVIQLSDALTVPRTERNVMLNRAGFAATYRQRNLDDEDMSHVRSAVMWTLERHDPYPAMAVDRHWRLVRANRSAGMLLSSVGIFAGDSMLEAALSSSLLRGAVVNWREVVRHIHQRLRTESAHLGGDAVLDAAAAKLGEEIRAEAVAEDSDLPAVVPTRLSRRQCHALVFLDDCPVWNSRRHRARRPEDRTFVPGGRSHARHIAGPSGGRGY